MRYDLETVEEAVKNSSNYSDVFRNLGIKINGGSYRWIKKLVESYKISTTHFSPKGTNFTLAGAKSSRKKSEEVNSADRLHSQGRIVAERLRKYLIFNGIKLECSCCKLIDWLDQPITLDVDHINNDPFDNHLVNLQFLCPNCHRQKTQKNKLSKN